MFGRHDASLYEGLVARPQRVTVVHTVIYTVVFVFSPAPRLELVAPPSHAVALQRFHRDVLPRRLPDHVAMEREAKRRGLVALVESATLSASAAAAAKRRRRNGGGDDDGARGRGREARRSVIGRRAAAIREETVRITCCFCSCFVAWPAGGGAKPADRDDPRSQVQARDDDDSDDDGGDDGEGGAAATGRPGALSRAAADERTARCARLRRRTVRPLLYVAERRHLCTHETREPHDVPIFGRYEAVLPRVLYRRARRSEPGSQLYPLWETRCDELDEVQLEWDLVQDGVAHQEGSMPQPRGVTPELDELSWRESTRLGSAGRGGVGAVGSPSSGDDPGRDARCRRGRRRSRRRNGMEWRAETMRGDDETASRTLVLSQLPWRNNTQASE